MWAQQRGRLAEGIVVRLGHPSCDQAVTIESVHTEGHRAIVESAGTIKISD
jgi:hypothetical protein